MGKRQRARTRADAEVRVFSHQHMARVNVDAETWTAFRVQALRAQTSVASYLGDLVDREVARVRRRDETPPTAPQ